MASPSITVRQLNTANGAWDPLRGNGLANFLSDIDAVTQILNQRLRLLQGEVFYNDAIGVPVFQQILGVPNTNQGVELILRQQMLAFQPWVTDVLNLNVSYSGVTRAYSFSATVMTVFGTIQIVNQPFPGTSARIT